MVKYRIEWNRTAAKELKKIDTVKLPKIISKVDNQSRRIMIMRVRHRKDAYY